MFPRCRRVVGPRFVVVLVDPVVRVVMVVVAGLENLRRALQRLRVPVEFYARRAHSQGAPPRGAIKRPAGRLFSGLPALEGRRAHRRVLFFLISGGLK